MATALTALGAQVRVLGPDGERTIPMPGLHRLPGDTPEHDTVLAPGELIVAVDVPPLGDGARGTYRKVRDRASFAFGLVTLAAVVEVSDGTVVDARLALGPGAHAALRCELAEDPLRGAPATPESFARAADAELAQAQPLRDN